jgi:inner membrane protein
VPTPFTHPVVPLALGLALGRRRIPLRLVAVGAIASVLPDADVIAFRLGISYADALGHRGASHSLAFALVVALLASALHAQLGASWRTAIAYLFAAAASHPLLDALTNGGLGVALLWPLSDDRFFAPVTPIHVAPFSPRRLFGVRAADVFGSEALCVWLPCAAAAALAWALRLRGEHRPDLPS